MRPMPLLTGTAATLGLTAGLLAASAGTAHAANCGGQSAAPQPVPYTCTLPGIDITVGGVTRHFSAVVRANGTTVEVDFTMAGGVLTVDVPIRIVHHEGISGAGGTSDQASGFIRAGSTTATLSDSAPCRAGQLDIKAVNTTPASGDRFRIGGPWITNGTGCIDTGVITPPPATTPPPALSTPPPTTVLGPETPSTPPVSQAPPTGRTSGALPATGADPRVLELAAVLLLGSGLFMLRRASAGAR